ncbi:OsmC family protein [uncultured Winogradskyella sp.]|uniref:OsmC family protein n=1 Tax=uncultured Winogradskyella sp. TaxID=395353 RepID=UPI0026136D06|nr:OsmC family protein [uncultured Winogradskyella sp.]
MREIKILYNNNNKCSVAINNSNTIILTQSLKEFGWIGEELSSTDMLAAALGTCIATTIENILESNNISHHKVEILVKKELSLIHRGIKSISIDIIIKEDVKTNVLRMIKKAARTCLVSRILLININISVLTLLPT